MSSNFSGNPNNILPEDYIIPNEPSQKDVKLREYFNNIATAVNTKDSGIYNELIIITGQQFLPLFSREAGYNAIYRTVFRKVVDFGALPNSSTKSVAHNIPNITTDYSITKLYGASTNPGNQFISLPYASPTLAKNIELYVDTTNVNVVTGNNRTAFTRTFIIIEYMAQI